MMLLFSETVFLRIGPLFHRTGPRVSQDRTFSKTQRCQIKETHCIGEALEKFMARVANILQPATIGTITTSTGLEWHPAWQRTSNNTVPCVGIWTSGSTRSTARTLCCPLNTRETAKTASTVTTLECHPVVSRTTAATFVGGVAFGVMVQLAHG